MYYCDNCAPHIPQLLPIDCIRIIRSFLPVEDAHRWRRVCKGLRYFLSFEEKFNYPRLVMKLFDEEYWPHKYKESFRYFMKKIGSIPIGSDYSIFKDILIDKKLYPYYEVLSDLKIYLPADWLINRYSHILTGEKGSNDLTISYWGADILNRNKDEYEPFFTILYDQLKLNKMIREDVSRLATYKPIDAVMIRYFEDNHLFNEIECRWDSTDDNFASAIEHIEYYKEYTLSCATGKSCLSCIGQEFIDPYRDAYNTDMCDMEDYNLGYLVRLRPSNI